MDTRANPGKSRRRTPNPWVPWLWAVVASATVHGGGAATLWLTAPPDLDLQFERPQFIELGFVEAAPEPPPPTEEPSSASPTPVPTTPKGNPPQRPNRRTAPKRSAPAPPPVPPETAPAPEETQPEPPNENESSAQIQPLVKLPGKAFVAIRLDLGPLHDMPGIRNNLLAFVKTLPHTETLLSAPGMEPLISRVLLLSPTLRYEHTYAWIETNAPDTSGTMLALWKSRLAEHVEITPITPQQFLIGTPGPTANRIKRWLSTQPLDTPTAPQGATDKETPVNAAPREQSNPHEQSNPDEQNPTDEYPIAQGPTPQEAADKDTVVRIQWLGLEHFFRGSGTARALEGEVRWNGGQFLLHTRGVYPTAEAAQTARAYWEGAKRKYGSDIRLQLTGMSGPILNTEVEVVDTTLKATTTLTSAQLRLVLSMLSPFVGQLIHPPEPATPTANISPTGSPPAGNSAIGTTDAELKTPPPEGRGDSNHIVDTEQ